MGKNVKNDQWLAFRLGGALYFTGCVGHGAHGEHRTGRLAVDVAGLRVGAAGRLPGLGERIGAGAAQVRVLEALAERYGWEKQPTPVAFGVAFVPEEQTGIGIELDSDQLVCLPVIGGAGRHECPEHFRDLRSLGKGLDDSDWYDFLSQRTATEQQELRAVVEALRLSLY